MDRIALETRTRKFHLDVIRICADLPKNPVGFETGKQLIRAAGSVGANYRASKRAKSSADFIHKISIVLEEADEVNYWLGIVKEAELMQSPMLDALIKESGELTAIFAATTKTAKNNLHNK